jgi:hypothetical protein
MRTSTCQSACHRMTEDQLHAFVVANGLERGPDGLLLAPNEAIVGIVTGCSSFRVTIFEEEYERQGEVVRAWWPTARPSWILIGGLADDGDREVGPPLGPDEAICDLCNATITTRPVPVVSDYALCQACFQETGLPFPGTVEPYVPHIFEELYAHA